MTVAMNAPTTNSSGTLPLVLLAIFNVLASVGILCGYFLVIPQFASRFRNFGADLPALTLLTIAI